MVDKHNKECQVKMSVSIFHFNSLLIKEMVKTTTHITVHIRMHIGQYLDLNGEQ